MMKIKLLIMILLVKSELEIYSDIKNELRDKKLEYEILHYGKIPMGRTIIGKLMILNIKDKENCTGFNHIDSDSSDVGIALITYLGNCNPIVLSKNAELLGGKFLILIDDQKENKFINKHLGGSKINIPTIIMSLDQGKIIYDYTNSLDSHNLPYIGFSKKVEKSDIVDMKLVTDLNNFEAYMFLDNFMYYIDNFGGKLKFDFLFTNKNCEQKNVNCSEEEISKYCKNGKLYCRLNGNLDELYDEAYLKCANKFKIMKQITDVIKIYCEGNINRNCINERLTLSSQFIANMSSCISNSINVIDLINENNKNYNKWKYKDYQPLVWINNVPYFGSLTPENIFEAICQAFLKSPVNCLYIDKIYRNNDDINKIKNKKNNNNRNFFFKLFFFILFLLIISGIFLYFIFTKAHSKVLETKYEYIKENVINYRSVSNNE